MTPTALSALPAEEYPLGREPQAAPKNAGQVSFRGAPSKATPAQPPPGMSAEEAAEAELQKMRGRRDDSQPAAMVLPRSKGQRSQRPSNADPIRTSNRVSSRGATAIPERGEESVMLEMPTPEPRRTPTAIKAAEAAVADAIRSNRDSGQRNSPSDEINLASYSDAPAVRPIVFDPQQARPSAPMPSQAAPGAAASSDALLRGHQTRTLLLSAALLLFLLAGAATLTLSL
jgi:hypothetical protein